VKLKKLLELHEKQVPAGTLKASLGDGHLLKTNLIYRNIRTAALEFGFQFSSERFHDYDVLSLTQLPKILEQKVIPYRDSVSALKEVEAQAPGRFTWEELPPLKANHAFHEAAHGVSHFLSERFTDPESLKKKRTADQELILRTLTEESFSNACESLANLFVKTDTDHVFFCQNSYVLEPSAVKMAFHQAINRFGLTLTFRILFLSFLFANFLKTKSAVKEYDRVVEIVFSDRADELNEWKKQDLAFLKKVFRVGLDLDPEFTIFTNGFCLKLMGVQKNVAKQMNFDFLAAFEPGGKYQRLLWVLSDLATATELKVD
jgi:hypothetical protein